MEVRETEYFRVWIKNINDKKTQAIINARIRRISHGLFGDCRNLGDGISELKIDYGPGFRVYFTIVNNEIVILLCGGDKSTQSKNIEEAKRMKKNL